MTFIWQRWSKHVPDEMPNPSSEQYTSELTGDFMIDKYMEDVEKFFSAKTKES